MFQHLQHSLQIVQSLKLSSDCVLNFNGKWLLMGKRDGMVWLQLYYNIMNYKYAQCLIHCQVLMWEVTPNGIELASQSQPCFEVAGQVTSIDTHGEYAAVGSTVVQLVKLTDFALNKRILVHKSMESMV